MVENRRKPRDNKILQIKNSSWGENQFIKAKKQHLKKTKNKNVKDYKKNKKKRD